MTPTPFFYLVVLLVIGLPIGWFVAEFCGTRRVRISLGVLSILMSFAVAWVAGSTAMFNANAWFGSASADLIDTTIGAIEAGNTKAVVAELKRLQEEYRPTYENRARYDRLVEETVQRIKASQMKSITTHAE